MRTATRVLLALALCLVAMPVLVVGAVATYLGVTGTPLIDEWHCSEDSAPVLVEDGGSYCAKSGATLADGESWDPLGNRPHQCHDRWGWTEIYLDDPALLPEDHTRDDIILECIEEGLGAPTGWKPVPAGWAEEEGHPRDW